MKTLEVSRANKPLSDYARSLGEGALLLVREGKPMALLSSVEGMDAESISLANNPKFVAIIDRSRAQIAEEGGIPIEEVRRRLGIPAQKKKTRRSKKS